MMMMMIKMIKMMMLLLMLGLPPVTSPIFLHRCIPFVLSSPAFVHPPGTQICCFFIKQQRVFSFCQRYQPHGGESCDLLTSHVGSQRGSCGGLWDAGGFVPDFHNNLGQPDLFDLLEGGSFLWEMKQITNKYNRITTDKSCYSHMDKFCDLVTC